MATYFDCNATTPVDPQVCNVVLRYLTDEYGNAGSRSHEYGLRAKEAVQQARQDIAELVDARREDVIFTSGATESNNLAILGLVEYGIQQNRRHIVSTEIEHKAVLEPLEKMRSLGFDVTLVSPDSSGVVASCKVLEAVRHETLLVSVMHVNNETGAIQPLREICDQMLEHPAYLHTDAAQGFGKELKLLRHPRLDMISVSGHKLYAPKGIGALIMRRRRFDRPPISPIMFGGGQERGLRPGTLPVHQIVGLGTTAKLAVLEHADRVSRNAKMRSRLLEALEPLKPVINGDPNQCVPHVLNCSFTGIDSESIMLTLKDLVAISNGSACTSHQYTSSHVLSAMGLPEERIESAIRWSWCHLTPEPDWQLIVDRIRDLA